MRRLCGKCLGSPSRMGRTTGPVTRLGSSETASGVCCSSPEPLMSRALGEVGRHLPGMRPAHRFEDGPAIRRRTGPPGWPPPTEIESLSWQNLCSSFESMTTPAGTSGTRALRTEPLSDSLQSCPKAWCPERSRVAILGSGDFLDRTLSSRSRAGRSDLRHRHCCGSGRRPPSHA
jgi:hypothetical protein